MKITCLPAFAFLLSGQLLFSQNCNSYSQDSVEYTKQLYDVFFSPSGQRGIATGSFAYNVLYKEDSVYWEKKSNNFINPDGDMVSGQFIHEEMALAVDGQGYVHTIVDQGDELAWGREKFWHKGLYDIDFLDISRGIIVGVEGCILRTVDFDGGNFDTIQLDDHILLSVDVVDTETVYIGGKNYVGKSTDFGTSWMDITPPGLGEFIDLKFFNENEGVLISDEGQIHTTRDGGESWMQLMDWKTSIKDLAIFNDSIIYVCGGYEVMVSYDKGNHWYRVPGISDGGMLIQAMHIVNQDSACFVDYNGGIYTYKFGTNVHPTDILISDTAVYETGADSLFVADISVTDRDGNDVSLYIESEFSSFYLENNTLRNKFPFSFSGVDFTDIHSINLVAVDACGFEYKEQAEIRVLPYGPTELSLSNNEVRENLPTGTFVGKLNTVSHEESPFTYELVPGNNSTHNDQFLIRNDSLFTNSVFTVDVFNSREIRVRTTDDRENSIEQAFFLDIVQNTGVEGSFQNTLLYPNPVSDILFLPVDQVFQHYEIINSNGVEMQRGEVQGTVINVEDLSVGVYYLLLFIDNNSLIFKLIKN